MVNTATVRFRGYMASLRQSRKRNKASDHLRESVARFNKSTPDMVSIDPKLNDFIMSRAVKGGDSVKVEITKNGARLNVKLAPGQVAASTKPEPAKTAATKPVQQQAKVLPKTDQKTAPKKEEKPKPAITEKKPQENIQKPAKAEGAVK